MGSSEVGSALPRGGAGVVARAGVARAARDTRLASREDQGLFPLCSSARELETRSSW